MVRVVTDSTANLSPEVVERLGITVIPLNIHFGKEVLREGIDITSEEFFRRFERTTVPPFTSPPSAKAFHEAYTELSKETDEILSIHVSSKLSGTIKSATHAAEALLGRYRIEVVDSLFTSLGLGWLTIAAAEAAEQGATLDEIIRLMRVMIPHIYIVFFVETLEYLEREGRIGKAQALLGTMLNIKPLLIIEDGEILPLEKVRSREKAIERLYEFAAEFVDLEKIAILQSTVTEEAYQLAERIDLLFPEKEIVMTTYGPVLTTHFGLDAMGIVVYEGI